VCGGHRAEPFGYAAVQQYTVRHQSSLGSYAKRFLTLSDTAFQFEDGSDVQLDRRRAEKAHLLIGWLVQPPSAMER
jgi:hypothetical protein